MKPTICQVNYSLNFLFNFHFSFFLRKFFYNYVEKIENEVFTPRLGRSDSNRYMPENQFLKMKICEYDV